MRTLVKQLCLINTKGRFPQPVLSIYEKRVEEEDSGPLSLNESKDLLVQLSAGFPRTTILIDALDECDKSTRKKLVDALQHVVTSPNLVRVFVTSRDDGDLVNMLSKTPSVYIHAADNSGDISKYIKSKIERCIKDRLLLPGKEISPDLKETIVSTLEKGAGGMYVFVSSLFHSNVKSNTCLGSYGLNSKFCRYARKSHHEMLGTCCRNYRQT